ncbi:MAG: four helix bundle protein [Anaerolineaceae bacterium]|nr:four helix bundle protein [Anaerolineaceae bacterium]
MTQREKDKGLETLQVWRRAMDFAVKVCRTILPRFPEDEKWALTAQFRRSVQSVPANIAEGYGRYSFQEGLRFGYIARGSLEEVYTQLTLAFELGYLNKVEYDVLVDELQNLRHLLNGYLAYLKKRQHEVRDSDVEAEYLVDPIPNP